MPSILFVCTANQFCSPLAAACLLKCIQREPYGDQWRIESAGTRVKNGKRLAALAAREAARLGLEGVKNHLTRPVSQELIDQFDLILVMDMRQLESLASGYHNVSGRIILLSEIADGLSYGIDDPEERGIDPSEIASQLDTLIGRGREKIMQWAEFLHRARDVSHPSDS